jgi:carbamoyl-phosphate synthase large subunit
MATEGTARFVREQLGLPVEAIAQKLDEGHPNVEDVITSGRVSAVVNTVTSARRPLRHGFFIRRAAAERRLPCFTSLDTLRAALASLGHAVPPRVLTVDEYREPAVARAAVEAGAGNLAGAAAQAPEGVTRHVVAQSKSGRLA